MILPNTLSIPLKQDADSDLCDLQKYLGQTKHKTILQNLWNKQVSALAQQNATIHIIVILKNGIKYIIQWR